MALTATATNYVKEDVLRALRLQNAVCFRMSFNRPNLMCATSKVGLAYFTDLVCTSYEVKKKDKNTLANIAKFIKEKYPDESGIVYAFSRHETEMVAERLCVRSSSLLPQAVS